MDSLQEKFQISVPPAHPEDDHKWTTFQSQRHTGEAAFEHTKNQSSDGLPTDKTNFTPPGMDISNQVRKRIHNMPLVMAGESDVSKDTNSEALEKGFTRRHMEGTDDQYSGEHMDFFYAEAKDEEGNVGFVERANYLDRE